MDVELGRIFPTEVKSRVRLNTIQLNKSLDTNWPTMAEAEDYRTYLNDRIKYPTITRAARREFVDKTSKIYDSCVIWRNEQIILNQDKQSQDLLKVLKSKLASFYPRTQKAREYIIKNDRVIFDGVKKVKHYSWFDKLGVLLTKVRVY